MSESADPAAAEVKEEPQEEEGYELESIKASSTRLHVDDDEEEEDEEGSPIAIEMKELKAEVVAAEVVEPRNAEPLMASAFVVDEIESAVVAVPDEKDVVAVPEDNLAVDDKEELWRRAWATDRVSKLSRDSCIVSDDEDETIDDVVTDCLRREHSTLLSQVEPPEDDDLDDDDDRKNDDEDDLPVLGSHHQEEEKEPAVDEDLPVDTIVPVLPVDTTIVPVQEPPTIPPPPPKQVVVRHELNVQGIYEDLKARLDDNDTLLTKIQARSHRAILDLRRQSVLLST